MKFLNRPQYSLAEATARAEQAYRATRRAYPSAISPTRLYLRLIAQEDKLDPKSYARLMGRIAEADHTLFEAREATKGATHLKSSQLVHKMTGVLNCGEYANLAYNPTKIAGLRPVRVSMTWLDNADNGLYFNEHEFLVGNNPRFNARNPRSWHGEEVVLDAQNGVIAPLPSALREFTRMYKLSPEARQIPNRQQFKNLFPGEWPAEYKLQSHPPPHRERFW